jgi:hypothetical protein
LPDDPTWLRHLSEHIKYDEPVIVESPLTTEDAADHVSQVSLFNLTIQIGLDAIALLLRNDHGNQEVSLLWSNVSTLYITNVHIVIAPEFIKKMLTWVSYIF